VAQLSFRLLGRVGAVIDGHPLSLPPRTSAVLARLLVARGGLVTIDELFIDVWGHPGRAINRGDRVAVQKRIAELRAALGGGVVVTDAGSPTAYRLVADPQSVDAFSFEAAVERGNVDAALAIWHDRPLVGLSDLPFAAKLEQRLTQLHGMLLNGPAASPSQQGQSVPAGYRALPAVWQMPARIVGFIARPAAAAAIDAALPLGPAVLCGIGGVGKTRLAIEYSYQHADRYQAVWWIDADDDDRIGDQLSALAVAVGACGPGTTTSLAIGALNRHLRAQPAGCTLLVFDNADTPDEVSKYLLDGADIVITSRNPHWTETATAVPVHVFARAESVAMLQSRVDGLTESDAHQLAEQLGDLPLALAQAAGVMATQGITTTAYLEQLNARAAAITDVGRPRSYPTSLAAAVTVARQRLDPDAQTLLDICAQLAPETVPIGVLRHAANSQQLRLHASLEHTARFGLARVDVHGLLVHRLTQAILRDRISAPERAQLRRRAEAAVAAAAPDDGGDDPATWPLWQALIPHVLALEPGRSDDPALREFAGRIPRYMSIRGDVVPGRNLAQRLYDTWQHRLGPTHPHTLQVAGQLTMLLFQTGSPEAGDALGRATLAAQQLALGGDHPDTLETEIILVMNLPPGDEVLAAAQHNYRARQRVLGVDHRDTLWSALVYAGRLGEQGQLDAARDLARDTATRLHEVLGNNHPYTHQASTWLAEHLYHLGEHREALDIIETALPPLTAFFGPANAQTLFAQCYHALILNALGQTEPARSLARTVANMSIGILGTNHPYTIEALDLLSDLL
jgi:hypothetical protein